MDAFKIFCSYVSKDKELMESFRAHSRVLELLNVNVWYAHNILPGTEWERERDSQLYAAHITLFLVSSDFISSHEHYNKEVLPAMERHNNGETRVMPIILRPVDWQETSFGKLPPLPIGGKPVTDASWHTRDHAFVNIISGIKRVVNNIKSAPTNDNPSTQLEQIIQNFKSLRAQIASVVMMKGAKDFSLERCESQYNKLYGDTMVFLATYLPECISDAPEGFVETVHRKTAERLHKGNIFDSITVFVARSLIPPLAQLERIGMQIDACTATLESYKQQYFTLRN